MESTETVRECNARLRTANSHLLNLVVSLQSERDSLVTAISNIESALNRRYETNRLESVALRAEVEMLRHQNVSLHNAVEQIQNQNRDNNKGQEQ